MRTMRPLQLILLALTPAVTMQQTSYTTTPAPMQCSLKPAIAPDESVVLGGKEAVPHSWPWLVSIRLSGEHNCSGTIIGRRIVVTAAWCLKFSSYPESYVVVAGLHCLNCTGGDASKQLRRVLMIHSNLGYSEETGGNNVALLMVDEDFEFNDRVSAACTAKEPPADDARCVVIGWGSTWKRTESVNQAVLPIVPRSVCNDRNHYEKSVTEGMMCAGYDQGGINSCIDDIGSPLMCKGAGKSWYLHGISIWGDGCDKPDKPGVFTRVDKYHDWLAKRASEMQESIYE